MNWLKVIGLPLLLLSFTATNTWVFKGEQVAGQHLGQTYVAKYNQACTELLIIKFTEGETLPKDNWKIVYLNGNSIAQAEIRSLASDSIQVADPFENPYTNIYQATGGKLRIRVVDADLNVQLENATFNNGGQPRTLGFAEILW